MSNLNNEEDIIVVQDPYDRLNKIPSKEKYIQTYDNFVQWQKCNKMQLFSEDAFLAYFKELEKKLKPSSLWSIHSMLKSTMKPRNGIDIKRFSNLTAFLKRCSQGFKSSKTKVLSAQDVEKFLKEAPDNRFLAVKVALIFGINGACRRQELVHITTKDIEHQGEVIIVKINNTKNKVPRSFVIYGPNYEIVKKYEALRSKKSKSDRFFQNFQKGKCTGQLIGANKFGAMPKQIAKYLGLEDADAYNAHSFRSTSALLLANTGASKKLKRSYTIPKLFTEDLIENEARIGAEIKESAKKPAFDPLYSDTTRPSTSYVNIFSPSPSPTSEINPSTPYNTPSSPIDNKNNITQNLIQTTKMPSKDVSCYVFNNCTFTNCFDGIDLF